ncbi:hypothetical protein E7V67_001975 [[Empedobacter] haloabium]|uniref:Uncharacterized protein n=1 Tax=[Empedobacter] haloabium TaxID=592317 RepID=A0ABZ1UMI3_9BURK
MFLFRLILAIMVGAVGFNVGALIPLSEQWPYFEALRTTTSIVFGVMGALLAIVYPEVLKQGLRGGAADLGHTNLRRVLLPCANSAILLIVLVILAPVFAWVKLQTESIQHIQATMFALFCVLSYWQVIILQMVLFPMDTLFSNTTNAVSRDRLRRAIHTNGRG